MLSHFPASKLQFRREFVNAPLHQDAGRTVDSEEKPVLEACHD
jgi:hypothetical protein